MLTKKPVQAELDARMQELRNSEEGAAELNARLLESEAAVQAIQEQTRQLEQRLHVVQAEYARELKEARSAGQLATDEASKLRQRAVEELAAAQ